MSDSANRVEGQFAIPSEYATLKRRDLVKSSDTVGVEVNRRSFSDQQVKSLVLTC